MPLQGHHKREGVRGRETGDAALLAVRMEGGAVKSWKSREPLEGPDLPTLGFSPVRSKLDSRPSGL